MKINERSSDRIRLIFLIADSAVAISFGSRSSDIPVADIADTLCP